MERILIIGASGGIGSALVDELRARGSQVVTRSRSVDGFDVTNEAAVKAGLADVGVVDGVVVASGALEAGGFEPERALKALDPAALRAQFEVNALGPALVLKHVLPLLPRDRRSVVAVLTARVGSIGDNRLGGWYSYRAAKAAANQLVHGAAIELARTHEHAICVAYHPGTVATSFTRKYAGRHPTVPPEEAAQNLLRVLDGLTPADTGAFFDWSGSQVPW